MALRALHEPVDHEDPHPLPSHRRRGDGALIQEHGRYQWANSDNGPDAAEYRDLWTPPFLPDTHLGGDSTRPHPVSALVWLRSSSAPWHGPASRHGPGLYRQGVDIQQLRRQGTRIEAERPKKLDVLPQRPSFHHSLPLDQHVDVLSSRLFVCIIPAGFVLVGDSSPTHHFSLFSAYPVDTNSRRFASLCRAAITDSIYIVLST